MRVKWQSPASATNQSLPVNLFSPHNQTNWETLRGKHILVFRCLHAVQAERITTWQLSYQGSFLTKIEKVRKYLEAGHYCLWPSSMSIAKQSSALGNELQFCALLCKEIENCPQKKTAWKSTYFPVAFFLLPDLDFKTRNMGFSFKLTPTLPPKVLR